MEIRPTPENVRKYQYEWEQQKDYVLRERSLEKLFTKTYSRNELLDDVLIKVCALNDFYSTNIFNPIRVASHIVESKIDSRLRNANYSLVDDISIVNMGENKIRRFYSFASKYCSHHFPDIYPIYDSYVDKVLRNLRRRDRFSKFRNDDLKNYENFVEILGDFRTFYRLDEFGLKEIDRYLWLIGKEYYPRSYNTKQ